MPAAHGSSDLRRKGWKVKKILASQMNYWLVLMSAACSLLQGCGLNPIEAKHFLLKLLIMGMMIMMMMMEVYF